MGAESRLSFLIAREARGRLRQTAGTRKPVGTGIGATDREWNMTPPDSLNRLRATKAEPAAGSGA
jgi:hypothetical protein